jgi:predicted MFS family arabinose efflux permease
MATDYRNVRPAYRGYALVLLILMFTLANIDRSVLQILAEPIKRDYHLSDTQLGTLTGLAFAVPLSLIVIPIGVLADRVNRVRLVTVLMILWSSLTALTGLARSYGMLIVARMGLGAAEAGAAPTFTSLAGDIFTKERRGTVMGFLYLSSPLGTTIGFALGGFIAGHFNWRAAFFVVGIPGVLLALLAAATLREPRREQISLPERATRTASASSIGAIVKLLRERKVLWLLLLAGAFSIGGQAACSIFMAPFLIRVHGLTVGQAGPLLALTYGIGGMIGMPLGGVVTDFIRKRRPGHELGFFGIVNICVSLIAAAAFLVPDWRMAIALLGLYAAGAVFYYGVTFSSFVTETPSHLRAGASATMFLSMNLFGYGVAPQFAGIVSDLAAKLGFATPLRVAMVASATLFAIGGLFLILAGRALRRESTSAAEPALVEAA